jgi:hypothetical protein
VNVQSLSLAAIDVDPLITQKWRSQPDALAALLWMVLGQLDKK